MSTPMDSPVHGPGACDCCTPGGNSAISNGDEAISLQAVTGIPVVAIGYQEDDSHCVGVFRRADVAGS